MKKLLIILFVFTYGVSFGQHHMMHVLAGQGANFSTLKTNLATDWEMDEASGTAMEDAHTNNIDGTITGADVNQTGKIGAGYTFNGTSSDYVTVADNDIFTPNTTNKMSWSVWVNLANVTGYKTIAEKSGEYWLTIYNNQIILRMYQTGSTTTYVGWITAAALSTGWNHIVVVWNGLLVTSTTGMTCYVNGSAVTTSSGQGSAISAISNTASDLVVGKYSTQYFSGTMDQLAVWNKQLTSDEVTELYAGGTGISYANWGEVAAGDPPATYDADYFISYTDGSDTNDGLTAETPWKTINKINTSTFSAGEIIALKAGDEWNESLVVPSSGSSGSLITFTSYGEGVNPKLYGSDIVTSWTLHSGNIYKATLSATDVYQVFENGTPLKSARYPTTGYHDITTVNSVTQFVSTDLNASFDYAGCTLITRDREWSIATKTVTSSSGQTININSAPLYSLGVGEGFVLFGSLNFLTGAGQWFHDEATNTLYVWTSTGASPSGFTIRASVRGNVISASSKNYIEIDNIDVLHSNTDGIYLSACTYFTIDSTTVAYSDSRPIYISGSTSNHCTISNSLINRSNHDGVVIEGSYHSITNNEITNINLFANIGISGTGGGQWGRGIQITNGDYNTVEYNQLSNIGYNGIAFFNAPNTTIRYNYIYGTCMTKADGGGIYCFESTNAGEDSDNSSISYNIIEYVYGGMDGYPSTDFQGAGIYLDDRISYVTVDHNTIIDCSYYALFCHNNQNCTFEYNTLFDVAIGHRTTNDFSATGNVISNNIICNKVSSSYNGGDALMGMINPAQVSIVDINNNTYVDRHVANAFKRMDTFTAINFTTWKTATGEDAASTFIATALDTGETEEIFYNDTNSIKTFMLNGATAYEINGTSITTSFNVAAYSSKIVYGTNLNLIS